GLGESVQSEEAGRVDGPVVAIDLQMQVRSGGAAGGAHSRNLLALLDQITFLHHQLLGMSITGLVAVAVSDLDYVAIGTATSGVGNNAGADWMDRGAARSGEVQPGMHGDAPGDGVGTPTEAG